MPGQTKEDAFESYVDEVLLARGWKGGTVTVASKAGKCRETL